MYPGWTMSLQSLPDTDTLLALHPSELAWLLLGVLKKSTRGRSFHIGNVTNFEDHNSLDYRKFHGRTDEVGQALMEAHGWLRASGLIAKTPGNMERAEFVTRRGASLTTHDDFRSFVEAATYPMTILHKTVRDRAWALFQRGDLDTAVFSAFKALEVEVRAKGGFEDTDIGVKLMREAFKPGSGPLRQKALDGVVAEQEAEQNLFAGAIGYYKNPGSHRDVPMDMRHAFQALAFASHLLDILDKR